MTIQEKTELRAAFVRVFQQAIDEIGSDAFKRMSWFGSNDPAFKASKMKQAA